MVEGGKRVDRGVRWCFDRHFSEYTVCLIATPHTQKGILVVQMLKAGTYKQYESFWGVSFDKKSPHNN